MSLAAGASTATVACDPAESSAVSVAFASSSCLHTDAKTNGRQPPRHFAVGADFLMQVHCAPAGLVPFDCGPMQRRPPVTGGSVPREQTAR